nr:hypothetical protein [Tanacetum cinerariifolium]
ILATAKAKNINGEAQIHAKVMERSQGQEHQWRSTDTRQGDGKKVIISEATIRRDLKFEDEGGVD